MSLLLLVVAPLVLSQGSGPLPPPFEALVETKPDPLSSSVSIFAPRGALSPRECAMGWCSLVVLEAKGPRLCLAYDDGPSGDPTFNVYAAAHCAGGSADDEPLWSVGAKRLIVTGQGALYTSGHTNTLFDVRRKFEVKSGAIREVRQPFFYVSRRVTLAEKQPWQDEDNRVAPVVLRSAKDAKAAVVATVVEGAEVEILLAEGGDSPWFLVRTAFGLVGWYETPSRGIMPDALGIYFAGD